ncbi:MAG: hypothetical protein SPE59_06975 [Treponema sp.]|nr:hypothetical protein [Treponema sp.]
MKKISKVLALSLSALLLLAGCNNDDSTDLVEDETELTDNSGNGAGSDGSSTKPTGGNSGSGTDKPSEPSKPVSYEELPVVPMGNSLTRIDGAGIMINVDNTSLGITGDNAKQTTIDVSVTDTDTSTNVSCKSAQWDDYKGTETVRLYIELNEAHNNLKVDVKVQVNGVWYAKTVNFKNGAYEFEYEVTGITLSASAAEVKPGDSVDLTVKDTTYQLPQKATFVVSPENAGTVENGKFTAAKDANGEVTITATYADGIIGSVVINVNANAKPTVMNTSKITGNGIEVYVSKDVIADVPSIETLTIKGSLVTNEEAYKAYESDNLTLDIAEVNDQGTKMRIYFKQPNGFPDGKDITENFTISWKGVSIAVEFNGNVLSSSAITIE